MMNVKKFVSSQRSIMGQLINYSIMVMENLTELRQLMTDTTNSLMEGVGKISETKEIKEKMASAILVANASGEKKMQGDDSLFKNADKNTTSQLKKASEISGSCGASLHLKDAMKGFANVSQEIENSIMLIVGAMSADDVVGQRMNHVRDNLAALNKYLVKYKEVLPSQQEVSVFKEDLKLAMNKSHVMLEEQKVFDDVFKQHKSITHLDPEYKATQDLIDFIADYYQVLEEQLRAVVEQVAQALSLTGELIMTISSKAEEGKQKAEKELQSTYSGKNGSAELLEAVQADIDDIFEKVKSGQTNIEDNMGDKRRLLGHFSKHMESLSTLDEALSSVIMESMGSLSNEDVLKQRLTNMVKCLRLARQKMVATDVYLYENEGYVDRLIQDMNSTAYNLYVSNDERHIHKKYLGS